MTEIILAGKSYEIGTLTLGQMRRLKIGLIEKAPEKARFALQDDNKIVPVKLSRDDLVATLTAEWNQYLDAVATALSKAYPEMTVEALLDSEATSDELEAAYAKVLRHAGLIKDRKPGEAQPGADATSPGDGSTATSVPLSA